MISSSTASATKPRAPGPNANGSGSLQLIDAAQDNARVSNWSDGRAGNSSVYTGNLNSTHKPVSPLSDIRGCRFYMDDLALVAGSVAAVGPNLILNGDFEGPLLTNDGGPWVFSQPSLSNTVVTAEAKHSGATGLKLVHQVAGPTAFLAQNGLVIPTAGQYTLSFWYLPDHEQRHADGFDLGQLRISSGCERQAHTRHAW